MRASGALSLILEPVTQPVDPTQRGIRWAVPYANGILQRGQVPVAAVRFDAAANGFLQACKMCLLEARIARHKMTSRPSRGSCLRRSFRQTRGVARLFLCHWTRCLSSYGERQAPASGSSWTRTRMMPSRQKRIHRGRAMAHITGILLNWKRMDNVLRILAGWQAAGIVAQLFKTDICAALQNRQV